MRTSILALLPIQTRSQLQEIIDAECRTTGRNSPERIDRKQVRDVDQKGLQSPVGAVVKNTVLSPTDVSSDHFILISHQRVERMRDAESTRGFTVMTCSC
jgi:hypothetical protein